MPVGLDPNATFDLTLADADRIVDPAERPSFQCRFLTVSRCRQVQSLLERAAKAETLEAEEALLREAFGLCLVGWRNVRDEQGQPIAFSLDRVDDVLTPVEKWELARKMLDMPTSVEIERKKSGWQSPLAAVRSAGPVPTTAADGGGTVAAGMSPDSRQG